MPVTDILRDALPGLKLDLADVVDRTVSKDEGVCVSVHRGRPVRTGRTRRDWYARIDIAGQAHWPGGLAIEAGPQASPDLAVADLGAAVRRVQATLAGLVGKDVTT